MSRVRRLCDSAHVTPFMVMLAATSVVLGRYSGQDDLTVGSPIAARDRPETEALIGFCADNLVLRMRPVRRPHRRRAARPGARDRRWAPTRTPDVPFERLVEELAPDRDPARTPLFQVALSAGETRCPTAASARRGWSRSTSTPAGQVRPGAAGDAARRGAERRGCQYNTDLFDAATIERMLGHLCAAGRRRRRPRQPPVARSRLLTADERARELVAVERQPAADFPVPGHPRGLSRSRSRERPDAVAVELRRATASRTRELNAAPTGSPGGCAELGVGPDVLVGLSIGAADPWWPCSGASEVRRRVRAAGPGAAGRPGPFMLTTPRTGR